jgi:DDE domain
VAERGLKLDHSIQQIQAPIEELKRSCELGRNCRCRRAPYLNILENDHPFVKKRMISSQWFRSVDGALRTIAEYEAMNIVRKRQIRWLFRQRTVPLFVNLIDSLVQQRATRWTLVLASQLIIRIYL